MACNLVKLNIKTYRIGGNFRYPFDQSNAFHLSSLRQAAVLHRWRTCTATPIQIMHYCLPNRIDHIIYSDQIPHSSAQFL